jgi:predicted DNA-binding antitoxin AbrB/MazE fold protein
MKTIHAVYENGVFRPTECVDLPEHSQVEFEPRPVNGATNKEQALDEIHKILSRSYDTGIRDLAARHNEHQP